MKKLFLLLVNLVFLLSPATTLHAQTWSALGSGLNNTVYALAEYNNVMYAGGQFTTASGSHIAKWNGTSWADVGSTISGGLDGVKALAVYNGVLYAGGDFSSVGGVSMPYIAKWNGTGWSAVGTGLSGSVKALTVYNNELVAGGTFTTAGGITAKHIAKWNGTSWSALGAGVDTGITSANAYVSSFAIYNGDLCVGGDFKYPFIRLAKWNGSAWSSIGGSGTSGIPPNGTPPPVLCVYNNNLYVKDGTSLWKWSGTTWTNFASLFGFGSSDANAMTVYNNYLYIGGHFGTVNGTAYPNIVKWDGTSFSSAGSGIPNYEVWALCSSTASGSLYVGGFFSTAGGVSANNIATFSFCLPAQTITPSSSTTICSGSSVTLSVNAQPFPPNYYQYIWQLNGVKIPGGPYPSAYSANASGNYSCLVTTICGSMLSNTITVTVNPLPPAAINASGSTTFCSGDSVLLNANTGSGLGYQWKLNGSNISGAVSSSFYAKAAGNYTCAVSKSGCNATSNSITLTLGNCLYMRTFFQGYYTGNRHMQPMLYIDNLSTDPTACDSITIELHAATQPYAVVSSTRCLVHSDGTSRIFFPASLMNQSYYIVIRHRGSIGVWSKNPLLLNSSVMSFDFTSP